MTTTPRAGDLQDFWTIRASQTVAFSFLVTADKSDLAAGQGLSRDADVSLRPRSLLCTCFGFVYLMLRMATAASSASRSDNLIMCSVLLGRKIMAQQAPTHSLPYSLHFAWSADALNHVSLSAYDVLYFAQKKTTLLELYHSVRQHLHLVHSVEQHPESVDPQIVLESAPCAVSLSFRLDVSSTTPY
jgi:hypothetical protein